MRMPKILAFFLPLLAAGCGGAPDRKPVDPNCLYMRLGGLNGMAALSDEIVNRLLTDPEILANTQLQMRARPENVPGIKVQITVLLSDLAGGPFTYSGKSMKEAHQGMAVDEKQWQAMLKDVRASLEKLKVPAKEGEEFVALIEAMRGDIVEVK